MVKVSRHRADYDAAKGILISLIVLGHNYFFSRYFSDGFALLYNFHVASFLLFPFIFGYDRIKIPEYGARMFRTLVPQAGFLLLTIPIYYVFYVSTQEAAHQSWPVNLSLALLLQTETRLELVTGFRHFWFLPAMALLISLLWVLERSRVQVVGIVFLIFGLWHFFAGELRNDLFQFIPWGLAIVGFIFLPGLVVRYLSNRFSNGLSWNSFGFDLLVIGTWFGLSWFVIQNRLFMPLAGDPYNLISGWEQPVRLFFQDSYLVLSFFAVLRLGGWLRRTWLVSIGQESLKIFLLSPLVWQVFWMLGGSQLKADTNLGIIFLVATSFICTILATFGLSKLVALTPLRPLLFPRDPSDWKAFYALYRKTLKH